MGEIAEKYVAYVAPRSGAVDKDFDKLSLGNENGFLWDTVKPGSTKLIRQVEVPKESTPETAEIETESTSSTALNQQVQKRANSPRLQQSGTTKRSKEELNKGSQNLSASRHQKNGHHPVS
ncbi:hypothetical protein L484_015579 [Morus notabilis]|uniref:Uncharacterized protein n=1 Tax=Morus notabilis TaxID=981085 RepID=W9SAX2_9ROSA|nr:hypothetical protein L484_015579 [Morus notabilis]